MTAPAIVRANGQLPAGEPELLTAILDDPSCVRKLWRDDIGWRLVGADFEDGRCAIVYGALIDLLDGDGADTDTVLAKLAERLDARGDLETIGGPGFLDALRDRGGAPKNLRVYARTVVRRAVDRLAAKLAPDGVADAIGNPGGAPPALRLALERLEALQDGARARKDQAVLRSFADVQPEPVSWLWRPYIPLGKLTLLEGDPGLGKTWLALECCARLSIGWPMGPLTDGAGQISEPRTSLFLTGEDGVADTLRPRLEKMGADLRMIHFLEGVRTRSGKFVEGFSLDQLDPLEDAMQRLRLALVVIDPLSAFMPSKPGRRVDTNSDAETRTVLRPLAKLAEQHGTALTGLRHLGKSPKSNPLYAGLGSIAHVAAARSALLVGLDPTDESGTRRVLVHNKMNLAAKGPSLAFEIAPGATPDEPGDLRWLGTCDVSAHDLVGARPEREPSGPKEAAAVKFIEERLPVGVEVESQQLKRQAKAEGISASTLRRAEDQAGVRARPLKDERGRVTEWVLSRGQVSR